MAILNAPGERQPASRANDPIDGQRRHGPPIVGRRIVRDRRDRDRRRNDADPAPEAVSEPEPTPNPNMAAARRIGESLGIALVASTGLYLVGSVWTDAYYGRLSIEATALDLAPPYVAVQAVHALPRLLEYPTTLVFLWVLWRTFASPARRLRGRFERAHRRFPRLVPALANLAVVAPLVAGAFAVVLREQDLVPRSVVTEAVGILGNAALALLAYAAWLGWSQRRFLVSDVRAHRPLPIALVFAVYLLSSLAATAVVAEQAAVQLLTGASDASLRVAFVPKAGALPELAGKELILVTARGGAYYAVERETSPPSQRPTAYVIPFGAVDAARVQRLNDADSGFGEIIIELPEE